VRALTSSTVTARPLADLGKRGLVVRLDAPARRTVDGIHRLVVATCHPGVSAREIAATLRELADQVERGEE
jgi:hypothetical protein